MGKIAATHLLHRGAGGQGGPQRVQGAARSGPEPDAVGARGGQVGGHVERVGGERRQQLQHLSDPRTGVGAARLQHDPDVRHQGVVVADTPFTAVVDPCRTTRSATRRAGRSQAGIGVQPRDEQVHHEQVDQHRGPARRS